MACGCSKKTKYEYVWTSEDGSTTEVYSTEMQAKARELRSGGSYEARPIAGG